MTREAAKRNPGDREHREAVEEQRQVEQEELERDEESGRAKEEY